MPNIKLHFYGDSHLTDKHCFRESFNEVASGLKSWRFSQVEDSSIHAQGGAVIDMNFVENFYKKMLEEEPFPQAHVFQVGGNNLRDALKYGYSSTVQDDVVDLFKKLIIKAGARKNVHLLFCSIVPSFKHEPWSKDLFWAVNQSIKELASSKPEMVSFVDLKLVAGVDHHAKPDFFTAGKIHLNKRGTMFMANRMAQSLQHLPASYLGIPSREEVFEIVNS